MLPKYCLAPMIQLVPSKFKVIDTALLSYIFVQHGIVRKIISDNLKECSNKIIKQNLKNVVSMDDCKCSEICDMELSDECQILLDNFIFFHNKYKEKITADLLTTYTSYLLITDIRLNSFKFFDDCLYVNEKEKVKSKLLYDITNCIDNDLSVMLTQYGKYLTSPLLYTEYNCFGREIEIQQAVNILSKLKKPNVLLCGNPGVGKTSIVYGICNYLQSDACPDNLKNFNVFQLNPNKLMSGTTFRGDLERRLDEFLDELSKYENTILFIDEIHSILGKNGSDDATTLQNVFKQYLSQGSHIIGCTTDQEYKVLEKDKAFERRFSVLHIEELDSEKTFDTLKSCKSDFENHHSITINDDEIHYLIKKCDEYIKNRYFPDKAFDLLDVACVECKNNHNDVLSEEDIDKAVSMLSGINQHGNTFSHVDEVCSIIKKDILGQDDAIDTVCKYFKRYFAGLCDRTKTIGNFLFVGPTGVGKTELCKQLSNHFFTPESFIRFDMSEFMEKHTISKLIGSPPGYIGHYEGGSLTERIKHNPFSIILFDEIEKAHPDVVNILLQIMDDGRLTDSFGSTVDFCNCVIVMTSNLGCKEFMDGGKIGFESNIDTSVISKSIKNFFSPEFINRLDSIVYFNKIDDKTYVDLIHKYVNEYTAKVVEIGKNIEITDNAIQCLIDLCKDTKNGARYVRKKVFDYLDSIVLDNIENESLICVDKIFS